MYLWSTEDESLIEDELKFRGKKIESKIILFKKKKCLNTQGVHRTTPKFKKSMILKTSKNG